MADNVHKDKTLALNSIQPRTAPSLGWSGVAPGKLQINDILFTIPPEQIQISQHYQNMEMPLLRSRVNSTLKSGHGDYYLNFPLLFTDRQAINQQLLPLLQQLRKTPFCLVENELVRRTIMPGTISSTTGLRGDKVDNIAFSLLNITVSTVPDLPGALQAHLSLMYFNYFPFSRRFTFKKDWHLKNPVIAPGNIEEARTSIAQYDTSAQEVYNPKDSQAWKAFWQNGFNPARQLTAELSNNFSLVFNLLNTDKAILEKQSIPWVAKDMIPVQINLGFSNQVAKLPILNWTYATHQYVGSTNCTMQVVFQMESAKRENLESLQYLIKTEQNLTAHQRYLSQCWGIQINNDLARLGGIEQVTIDDLNVDTVPGHPNLLQVVLTMRENHLAPEKLRSTTQMPQIDGILQQTMQKMVDDALRSGILQVKHDAWISTQPTKDSSGYYAEQKIYGDKYYLVPKTDTTGINTQVGLMDWRGGSNGDSLLSLLNNRPDKTRSLPQLPGQEVSNAAESKYMDSLRSYLTAALNGPLAQNKDFDALRRAAFLLQGNDLTNVCHPDLELPPHPVTGRVSDTEPDCYFFNESDSKPLDLSKALSMGLETIQQTYDTIKKVTSGSGGIGFDYQVEGNPTSMTAAPMAAAPLSHGIRLASGQKLPPGSVHIGAKNNISIANNNPGNLNYAGQEGAEIGSPNSSGGNFAKFATPEDGFAALMKDLAAKQTGNSSTGITGASSLSEWARIYNTRPVGETIDQYASKIAQQCGVTSDTPINQIDTFAFAQAVARAESSTTVSAIAAPATPTVTAPTSSTGGLIAPIAGKLISTFYDNRPGRPHGHFGGDIAADVGTPFYAPTTMTITATHDRKGNGMVYGIDASGNTQKFHHVTAGVQIGQTVQAGDQLGVTAQIGGTPHLDWKISAPDGTYIDWMAQAGLEKGAQLQLKQPLASTAVKSGGSVTASSKPAFATAVNNSNQSQQSTERGFGCFDSNPDYPGYNSALKSFIPTEKNMNFVGKNLSYKGQVIEKSVLGHPFTNPETPSQDLGPEGAKALLNSFHNIFTDNVLTMRRAYPAFALYLTDEFRQGFTFLNNSYNCDMVREIRLVRSRKNPVDTLVVQLSNTKGDLMTQQFNTLTRQEDDNAIAFNRQIIKEGTDVKLKLGYHNNPDRLETVFTGKITEIEGQHSAIITLVCQSYAIELFQAEYGDNPTASMGWFNSDTREIISSLLVLPECIHLGRWQPGQVVVPGESASQAAGTGYLDAFRYSFVPLLNPTDNNVFVPEYTGFFEGFKHYINTGMWSHGLLGALFPYTWLRYVPYRQLPWEIIEEMTLRHPGYIASVVPYDGFGHHKATLFFGLPVQNYYYKAMDNTGANALANVGLANVTNPLIAQARAGVASINNPSGLQQALNAMRGRQKPFRQYFYIDSEHHLIDNGIITSARDTYNAVEVAYVGDASRAFGSTNGAPNPSAFFTDYSLKQKANESIREDYCRWFFTRERNCEGEAYAERYAQGYLFRHLKDLYQGEIVITGEPAIKPYDQVFLYDSYNDMAGPFEVEQVTHIFSTETGFITAIVPDLVVQTNEIASMSLVDSLSTYFGAVWLGLNQKSRFNSGEVRALDLGDLPWTGVPTSGVVKQQTTPVDQALTATGVAATIVPIYFGGVVMAPISILVATLGLELWQWARTQNPIRVTPLVWKGRPFVCGLDGFTLDTVWGHAKNGAYRVYKGMGQFLQQANELMQDLIQPRGY